MTSYAVVIEQASGDGYGVRCPDLPGCVAVADTEDAALAEMRQAIELHLAGLRGDGQPIPHPSTVAATVITIDAACPDARSDRLSRSASARWVSLTRMGSPTSQLPLAPRNYGDPWRGGPF